MMENAEQLTSVPATFTGADSVDYVTVVSVGSSEPASPIVASNNPKSTTADYVTVLKIGNHEDCSNTHNVITEETYVYRLPGEKLGFGLKFEGGTKPDEFVKRLFIQSCAVNSPASRVQSSWGSLTEGEEVLEIDSVPVNSMTRIDCVRCLKNSNVVIKLLIKHRFDASDDFSKLITEDLPLVVSAEKKRTPPPPPPVPPRKVNRKSKDSSSIFIPPKGFDDGETNHLRSVNINNAKNHAYVNTRRSPEVSKSVRRRDIINPPDAEVYTDLFTNQESTYSLSESDDTGSSISTVVDRLGSFPTTTNSSFAGSLPSTPTPVQRHIELIDDIDFSNKITPAQVKDDEVDSIRENQIPPTLQPPANFQDAPLSYGNEHVPVVKHYFEFTEQKTMPPPPPPPRNKNQIFINIGGKTQVDDLPRLVDFVPKSAKKAPEANLNISEIVSRFLENEKQMGSYLMAEDNDVNSFGWSKLATIGEDVEEEAQPETPLEQKTSAKQKSNVAEDSMVDDASKGTCNRLPEPLIQPATRSSKINSKLDRFDVDTMDSPPIYSRQPPDGHEFPDYQEVLANPAPVPEQVPRARHRSISDNLLSKNQTDKNSVRDKIAIFSNASAPTLTKKYTSSENITLTSFSESLGNQQKTFSKSALSLDNINGFSSETPTFKLRNPTPASDEKTQSTTDLTLRTNKKEPLPRLHVRSQSLTNMTLPDLTHKQDRWSLMVEQRRKGLSKLKDLVIPEHVAENEGNLRPVLDLPEIKSNIFSSIVRTPEQKGAKRQSLPVHVRHSSTSCLPSSPWFSSSKSSEAVPKYSPAFKRKSLTIYGASLPPAESISKNQEETSKSPRPSYKVSELVNITVPTEAPKSLESITSPTRSDCSFEYVSSPEFRMRNVPEIQQTMIYPKSAGHNEAECAGRSEDDSDSDSALSSSQSSYVSKNSSTDSPVQLQIEYATDSQGKIYQNSCQLEIGNYDSLSRRLLKPQSVEAINRKNILASARCRSGRDLKVGSPLIQRKFEEDGEKPPEQKLWVSPEEPPEKNVNVNVNIAQAKEEVTVKEAEVVVKNIVLEKPVVAEIKEKPEFAAKTERRRSFERLPVSTTTTPNKKIPTKSFGVVAPATSVTDLRKNFEKAGPPPVLRNLSSNLAIPPHQTIASPTEEIVPIKRTSLPPYLVKTDPLKPEVVSDQAHESVICDILKEFGDSVPREDLKVIVLKPETLGRSLGITLAGGADYETKEITVHKIRNGSLAFTDGRLRKGDRILAINGKYMKGVSHGESMAALKEIVPEITIVACTATGDNNVDSASPKTQGAFKFSAPSTPDKVSDEGGVQGKGERVELTIEKDAAGLGFSIQGGKGSVQGDVLLTVKKLFMGGSAERSGKLRVNDELLEINGVNVSSMSRIDAWNLMKKLPEGEVVLVIRR